MLKLVVFDAYGTLFDVTAAARRVADEPRFAHFAPQFGAVARDWRLKQLQYTWIRAVTGAHADFWTVTGDALDWALEATGLGEDPGLRARLLALYRELDAFADVRPVLARLRAASLGTAILSNGEPAMLDAAVESAGIGGDLDAILSAEAARVFKPARAVYDLVGREFGTAPGEVLFVSANGWDAAAAAGYGFATVWVNRAGEPRDRLPWKPDHEIRDLSGLPDLVARH